MPIYEYRCDSCAHEFEAIQKFSDAPLSACPKCKANTVNKLVSAPQFQLKGTGWYETDFKTDKKKSDKTATSNATKEKTKQPQTPAKNSDTKKTTKSE